MGKRGQDDNDDAALWEKVVETAAPLKRGRNAAAPPKPAKIAAPVAKAKPPYVPRPAQSAPKPAPKPSHVPRAAPLDRQTSRQLDKGKLEVEARLDLHGLRRRDAVPGSVGLPARAPRGRPAGPPREPRRTRDRPPRGVKPGPPPSGRRASAHKGVIGRRRELLFPRCV
jgi:hypothetical protein